MILLVLTLFTWEWVETTQEDFRDGWFSRDLYSSHRGDGSVEFVGRWDANNDEWLDVTDGSRIFWGTDNGFSNSLYTSYDGGSGTCYADLNTDGYTEFISTGSIYIFWGKDGGPDPNSSTVLAEADEACLVADFNKDGYLDIAFDNDGGSDAGIYWGSSEGYSESQKTFLPTIQAQHNIETADFNKDGWLDVLFVNQHSNFNAIYWGSEEGFHIDDSTCIPYLPNFPHGSSVADLDSDGWLDLIFTGNYGISESWIYWGPDFETSQRTVFSTGECYGGSAVCDFNKDGLLDIIFFRGAHGSYLMPIYWGDDQRFQTDSFDLIGPSMSVSGGFVADFDQDGYHDVFLNGYLSSFSPVLYGPNLEERTRLNVGSHHALAREIGNVYTREYKEEYYSSIFDAERPVRWTRIYWEDSLPGESSIKLAVRTGSSSDTSSGWTPWVQVQNGMDIPGDLQSQYIQYCATFEYPNPAHLPVLFLVGIEYVLEAIIVRPDQDSAALPGETVTYQLNVINYTHDPDVVEISQTATQPTWSHQITDLSGLPLGDADSDGSPDVGEIGAEGDSTSILVHVGIPPNAEPGERDTLIVYGRSSNSDTLYDSALVVTRVLGVVDIVVDPNQIRGAYPGQDVTFPLWGINYGELPDVINLTAASRRGWDVELLDSASTAPLTDHNADGVPDLDTLAAGGGTEYFSVRVRVPSSLGAGLADTVYVIGRSSENPEITDLAMLIIAVLEIASLEIRPDQEASVSPETPSVLYGLEVINHGNGPETGDITFKSSLGWEVAVYDSTGKDSLTDSNGNGVIDVGELEAFGGSCSLYVEVQMPRDIDPTRGALDTLSGYVGAIETTWVYVSSASDGVVRDSAILVTSALPGLSVHNFPNPFRSETRIVWSQPEEGNITLRLADRAGRPVTTIFSDFCMMGVHSYLWEAATPRGAPLAPGVYILLLEYKPEEGRIRRIPYKMLCTEGRQ